VTYSRRDLSKVTGICDKTHAASHTDDTMGMVGEDIRFSGRRIVRSVKFARKVFSCQSKERNPEPNPVAVAVV
jgi:hypothetical protein